MSLKIALERIAKCKAKQKKGLDLSDLQLKEIPKEVAELTDLQTLYLFNNQINDIAPLSDLQQLWKLHLAGNQISDIAPLSDLQKLQALFLYNNKISDLAPLSDLQQLQRLHLTDNQICDIAPLSDLQQLQTLDSSHNQIIDIAPLSDLQQLQTLHLAYNHIIDIAPLSDLPQLQELNLASNQIIDIAPLSDLLKLQTLDSSHNQIIDIAPLYDLQQLKKLYLFNNKISNIFPLSDLQQLKWLNLADNQISDIAPLSDLLKLQTLHLANNQIIDIAPLSDLQQLQKLFLFNNQTIDITPLSDLLKLQTLDLYDNQIIDIAPLSDLQKLQELNLSHNQIIDIASLSDLQKLQKLYIGNNKIDNLLPIASLIKNGLMPDGSYSEESCAQGNPMPDELVKAIGNGREALVAYLEQLEKQGAEKVYEIKMLLVGQGGAGKTSLMEKLINPDFDILNSDTSSTVGVQIRPWEVPHRPQDIAVNIWDFGGQEIQFMTHQFFLTPQSFYILVADNRRQDSNYDYWFRTIRLLSIDRHSQAGGCSPVLVVLNDNQHGSVTDYDHDAYKEKYPELELEMIEVDFSKDPQFKKLRSTIEKRIKKLPQLGQEVPAYWPKIKQELHLLKEQKTEKEIPLYPHIPYAKFVEFCEKHELSEPDYQKTLIRYLTNTGFLLYFEDTAGLNETIFLHPEWAAKSTYFILEDKSVKENNGIFTKALANKLLKDQGYKTHEMEMLLKLLEKDHFEVCFAAACQEGTFYYAPQLLENNEPPTNWRNRDTDLRFRYKYGFMPEGIIPHLIVRLSEQHYLRPEDGRPEVWLNGMVLHFAEENCFALVKFHNPAYTTDQVIDIEVQGNSEQKSRIMERIREELDNLHENKFKKLTVEQSIPCSCEECKQYGQSEYYHPLSKIRKRISKGRWNAGCDKSGDDVSIESLMEGNFSNIEYAKFVFEIERHERQSKEQRDRDDVLKTELKGELKGTKKENEFLKQIVDKLAGKGIMTIGGTIMNFQYNPDWGISETELETLKQSIIGLTESQRQDIAHKVKAIKRTSSEEVKTSKKQELEEFVMQCGITINQNLAAAGVFEILRILFIG